MAGGVVEADVVVKVEFELAVGGVAVPFLYYFFELVDDSVAGSLACDSIEKGLVYLIKGIGGLHTVL